MPRLCSVCAHPQRPAIDLDLLRHAASYRGIARRYDLQDDALIRHEHTHLRQSFVLVKEANSMLSAENLLDKLADLDSQTLEMLADARAHDDLRLALAAVRESRNNIEAYSRIGVAGDLERRLDALEQGNTHGQPDDA